MKILKVTFKNFLTIGEATLALDDRGLVLVQGENKDDTSADSNGAGKSSLPDGLSWCFFGVTARGVTGDAVVNDTAKKNCSVSALLRDGENEYLVTRYRKHKEGKNGLRLLKRAAEPGLAPLDLTKGTDKLTQDLLEKIIGCSLDVFNAAVYAGQEKMPDLPGMTDKQLKLLVEEAAGVNRLQKAYEVARLRALERKSDHEGLLIQRGRMISDIDRRDGELLEIKSRRDTWAGNQSSRISKLAGECKDLKAELDEVNEGLAESNEAELREKIAKLDEEIAGRKAQEAEQEKLREALRAAERELATTKARFEGAGKELKHAKAHLDGVDGRVGSPCGECGKPYHADDLADARKLAEEKLATLKREALSLKKQVEGAAERAQIASEQLSAFTATMTDVSRAVSAQKLLRDEIAAIESERRDAARITDQLKVKLHQIKDIKAETNPFIDVVEKTELAIQGMRDRLKELEEQIAEAEIERQVADDAAKVFGPAGVRAHILDTVTPFLNDRTAHYLGTLSDGLISAVWSTLDTTSKGELREKFNIAVVNEKGAKSFAGLSGGQKRKVRLACAMALQDLVASRASKPIDLFIADEVDHALDEAGLERLMTILDEKARERGTVLVISHNSLSDWIREQIKVTLKDGFSSVEGVLCEEAGKEASCKAA